MSEQGSKLGASLAELQRRKVFRVGVGYAVAAFALLQLMSSISGAIELSPASMRLMVLGVLGGFPLALFLAWAYDITPRGIERTVEPEASHSSRAIELAVIAVLTVMVGGMGYLIYRPGSVPSPIATAQADVADRSIAVLPFANLSGDAANDYFGDGLAEEILNVLATVPNLRVAARTSSFAYKNRNEDVRRIGNELNVATVLEGSVRKSGDKVRITVQLINVADGFHLWSQNFDRTLSDIFTIQDEIAQAVAEALKVRLLGETSSAAKMGGTGNVDAYDLYLLGRHNMQQRTEQGLLDAVAFFDKALAADPNYARAWSGLADAYNLQTGYGNLTPGKAVPKAEAAALRALEIDPTLAEAHASLGLIRATQNRLKEAVAELETAIKLDPDYANAWVWYGTSLGNLQRPKEQLAAWERAYQLDSALPPAVSNLTGRYAELGRYRDALPLAERMVRLRPADASLWYERIGDGLNAIGVPAEAVPALRRALDADPNNAKALATMAQSQILLGDLDAAQRWVGYAQQRAPRALSTSLARIDLAIARHDATTALAAIHEELARSPSARTDLFRTGVLLKLLVHFDRPDLVAQLKQLQQQVGPYKADRNSVRFGPYVAAALRKSKRDADAQQVLEATLKVIEGEIADGVVRPDLQYTHAQTLALLGKPVEAVAALTLALQRGWIDAAFARRDPLLAALRDDATFGALLAAIDASIVRQREALAAAPLPPTPFVPPTLAPAVALTPAELGRLVGTFVQGDSNNLLQFLRVDDQLAVLAGDEPAARLVATGPLAFRDERLAEHYTFVLGPDGQPTHALVRSNGGEQRIKRVAFDIPKAGVADKRKYKDYPGTYDFGFKVTVWLEGERLMGRQDQQNAFEFTAEKDDVFFIPGAALRLMFVRDATGKVSALRLQQVDTEIDGPRLPPATPAP